MDAIQQTTLSENAIHVWRFSLIASRQEITSISHWLSAHERTESERMLSRTRRDKRIVAWGRLRFILSRYLGCQPSDIVISRDKLSRPEILFPKESNIQFNLSHSGSLGLAAISRSAIGIDIERIDSSINVSRLAARFFAPDEAKRLHRLSPEDRTQAFFRLWVLKEAHLKSHGSRVPEGLSHCEIALEKGGSRLCWSDFQSPQKRGVLVEIPVVKGYAAALACAQAQANITVFDL